MTPSAISGQQMLKKEYGTSPARLNGTVKATVWRREVF